MTPIELTQEQVNIIQSSLMLALCRCEEWKVKNKEERKKEILAVMRLFPLHS